MTRRPWIAALALAGLALVGGCASNSCGNNGFCIGNGQLLDRLHGRNRCPCEMTSMTSGPSCCEGGPSCCEGGPSCCEGGPLVGPHMMGAPGPGLTGPPPSGLPVIPPTAAPAAPMPTPLPDSGLAPPTVAPPVSRAKTLN
jgi:hypothetical protein